MANVFDVALYILKRQGEMTTMKLQKLVYYSQAWSLVWDEAPLFNEKIEAWANGPVVRELFSTLQGKFKVQADDLAGIGNKKELCKRERETIDAVLKTYGDKSAQWLSDLTHHEDPWRDARRGQAPLQRGDNEISLASMMEYYSGL